MGAFQWNDRERGHYTQVFALMQDHLDDKWKRLLAASMVLSLTGSLDFRILWISRIPVRTAFGARPISWLTAAWPPSAQFERRRSAHKRFAFFVEHGTHLCILPAYELTEFLSNGHHSSLPQRFGWRLIFVEHRKFLYRKLLLIYSL